MVIRGDILKIKDNRTLPSESSESSFVCNSKLTSGRRRKLQQKNSPDIGIPNGKNGELFLRNAEINDRRV